MTEDAWDAIQASLAEKYVDFCNQIMDEYEDKRVIGSVSEDWQPRGLIDLFPTTEPTPVDRAMAILAPHLARDPRYRPRAASSG